MSLHIAKLFKNPLALAGAALVIHIGAATAADSTGDIQQQMRDLLTGTITAHSAPQSGAARSKVTRPTADAQDLARQLLLGTTGSGVGDAAAIKQSEVARTSGETARQARSVAHGDTQAAARSCCWANVSRATPRDSLHAERLSTDARVVGRARRAHEDGLGKSHRYAAAPGRSRLA